MKYISSFSDNLKKVVTGITKGWKKKRNSLGKVSYGNRSAVWLGIKEPLTEAENRDSPTYKKLRLQIVKKKSKTMFLCEELQRFWISQHVEYIMSPEDWENLEKSSDAKRLNISIDCDSQTLRPHSLKTGTVLTKSVPGKRKFYPAKKKTYVNTIHYPVMLRLFWANAHLKWTEVKWKCVTWI